MVKEDISLLKPIGSPRRHQLRRLFPSLYSCTVSSWQLHVYKQTATAVYGRQSSYTDRESRLNWWRRAYASLRIYLVWWRCYPAPRKCSCLHLSLTSQGPAKDHQRDKIGQALHCPKNNMNLCIKTEPVINKEDATVNVWPRNQTYTVAITPAVLHSGPVRHRDFSLVTDDASEPKLYYRCARPIVLHV